MEDDDHKRKYGEGDDEDKSPSKKPKIDRLEGENSAIANNSQIIGTSGQIVERSEEKRNPMKQEVADEIMEGHIEYVGNLGRNPNQMEKFILSQGSRYL